MAIPPLLFMEHTEMTRESVPESFAGTMWGDTYLRAMYLVDLARLSPGHSVVVAGGHLIDTAVETLLSCNVTVTVLSEGSGEASVDAFIGCSMPVLARVLPRISTGGVVVLSCIQIATMETDFYSTVHRQGLTITGQVGDAFLRHIPALGRRLNRLLSQSERLQAAYRKQFQRRIAG